MKKKWTALFMAAVMAASFSTGALAQDGDEAEAAEQLLEDLTGSYIELWPVLFSEEYEQEWLDASAAIVGEENAQEAVDMMTAMVSSDIYGEEAAEEYADGEGGAYFCGFTQDLARLSFDGATISGQDQEGNELFSHEYQYIGMEESRGWYEFATEDEDAGEFTCFFLAPDTPETTYHIEFRYGSDAQALESYDTGAYAYWVASGISEDYDDDMARNAIQLFCQENLSQ